MLTYVTQLLLAIHATSNELLLTIRGFYYTALENHSVQNYPFVYLLFIVVPIVCGGSAFFFFFIFRTLFSSRFVIILMEKSWLFQFNFLADDLWQSVVCAPSPLCL